MVRLPSKPSKAAQARAWAFSGELVGLGLSSAGNGLQAATHGHGNGPVVVAMTIPGLLFIALRVLTTSPVTGWWRWLLWPGFGLLAGVFAVVSYRDQRALLSTWEFDPISAAILPLGIDGLMVTCAVALLALAASALPAVESTAPVADLADLLPEPYWDEPTTWLPTPQPERIEALPEWIPRPDYVEPTQDEYVLVPPPLVTASEEVERPRRTAPAGGRKTDPMRAEFVQREDAPPWLPMTAAELMDRTGGTLRSAESKIYRWRKALREEPVA